MDFKIKITCHKCNCDFELRPVESSCNEVICPNCSTKVPKEIASHLLNGLRELGSVPETYPENEGLLSPNAMFTFQVKSYSLFNPRG